MSIICTESVVPDCARICIKSLSIELLVSKLYAYYSHIYKCIKNHFIDFYVSNLRSYGTDLFIFNLNEFLNGPKNC